VRTKFALVPLLLLSSAAGAADGDGCSKGWLVSSGTYGLNRAASEKLVNSINAGYSVKVRLTFAPGDKDSLPTTFWFEPIALAILDDVVHAESAPLKWSPSRYSWANDATAVSTISIRASSNGRYDWVQGEEPSKTEATEIGWCLN
jgi:hypothetical protein